MNKIILPAFIFIICLSFESKTFAQPVDVLDFFSNVDDTSDKRLQLLNKVDAKYYLFDNKIFVFEYKNDLNRFLDSTGIGAPGKWDGEEIDFDKNTLVLFSYHGVDCHSRFRFGFGENDYLKSYFIRLTIFYGGCRAGGRYYDTWALIPKLPDGYEVYISERVIDRIHNPNGDYYNEYFKD